MTLVGYCNHSVDMANKYKIIDGPRTDVGLLFIGWTLLMSHIYESTITAGIVAPESVQTGSHARIMFY